MSHYSVNEAAAALIEKEILPQPQRLNVEVHQLKNGAVVLDMGIHCKGGFVAGKLFSEIGMGGLGQTSFHMLPLGEYLVPGLRVFTEDPGVCEMSSYIARTQVNWRGRVQVVSGPVRAILGSDDFAQAVSYRDPNPRKAVAGVQTEDLPDEELAQLIGEACGIDPGRLYIMAARTGCMTGAVQISARNVEQSMPTLYDRGLPMEVVLEGNATSPIVSVPDDELVAYGRVNDCLIYGQETNLYIDCDEQVLEKMLPDIPFSKNTEIYGTPFQELFARCQNSWANVPRDWDAPCRINFFNVASGKSCSVGQIGTQVLIASFLGEGGYV